eukprot:gene40590-49801_t
MAIGVSLGGTTGYAINPARDLGPRLMHALLPIPGKRDSDWGYALVPVVGSICGGVLAAVVYDWRMFESKRKALIVMVKGLFSVAVGGIIFAGLNSFSEVTE